MTLAKYARRILFRKTSVKPFGPRKLSNHPLESQILRKETGEPLGGHNTTKLSPGRWHSNKQMYGRDSGIVKRVLFGRSQNALLTLAARPAGPLRGTWTPSPGSWPGSRASKRVPSTLSQNLPKTGCGSHANIQGSITRAKDSQESVRSLGRRRSRQKQALYCQRKTKNRGTMRNAHNLRRLVTS